MKKMLLLSMVASVSLMAGATTQSLAEVQNYGSHAKSILSSVSKVSKDASAKASISTMPLSKSAVKPLAEGDVTASVEIPGYYWGVGFGSQYRYDLIGVPDMLSMVGPAYTPVTFVNTSEGATQYVWTYQDPNNNYEQTTSTDENLTVTYPFASINFPTLVASNGSTTDEFSGYVAQFGGSPSIAEDETGTSFVDFYVTPANPATVDQYVANVGPLDGTPGIEEFGVYYPKPAATYAISEIWVNAACDFAAGTELYADIYTISDDGLISEEPIATASFIAEDDYANNAPAGQITTYYLTFTVQVSDGVLTYDSYVNIDSAILIIFRGYDNVTSFDPLAFSDSNINAPGFVTGRASDGSYSVLTSYFDFNGTGTLDEGDGLLTGISVFTNATFGFLFPADNAPVSENNVVAVPTAGGSVTIPFTSYYVSANVFVEEDTYGDGTITDWLTYELADNASNSTNDLTLTAEALPAGVEGRSCYCTLSTVGAAPVRLFVTQGTVGVSAVVVESAAKVAVDGGNFVVTAPETINNVTVYNVAGQAVAASEIAGTTTIDASSLAKGVYILRFNDGTSVKVIK